MATKELSLISALEETPKYAIGRPILNHQVLDSSNGNESCSQ